MFMNLTAELNFEPCKIAYISYINAIYGYYIHGRGNVITCLFRTWNGSAPPNQILGDLWGEIS